MSDKRIKWSAGREEKFKDWIDFEVQAALSARATLEGRWRQWLEQYRAPANQATKHFPFEGASNYVMPVTKRPSGVGAIKLPRPPMAY